MTATGKLKPAAWSRFSVQPTALLLLVQHRTGQRGSLSGSLLVALSKTSSTLLKDGSLLLALSKSPKDGSLLSTEERISVPRMMQMLNLVRSKQAILPLLHLAAATSLTTSTLQQNCHRIIVIDGTTYSLAHQG